MVLLTDVYLSLNGTVIPNHGYVDISEIGYTYDSALLCHTNRLPSPLGANSRGNWFAPDGTRVSGSDVPGVAKNRGPMVVRLKRFSGDPPEGIYWCGILQHSNMDLVIVNVGLYNSGKGIQ